ncbi:WHG domain-containing protein [Streptomyces sp. NPDC051940]|uniref:TetR/AcrR family transcriptional regulator n=1 Tax=Streptomyces sp. NPDC051940 TaxID=3155675 RepID=UPI0034470C3D
MPRAGLSAGAVVDVALAVVDADGAAGLTLSAVASRAGVATPSLYKHVRNLAELRGLLTARVLDELADRVTDAVLGLSGEEAVRAFMRAYRAYAVEHPDRYGTMDPQPLRDERSRPAGERVLGVLLAVLRGFGLEGAEAVHAARAVRSAVHGFAVLEAAGGFGLPEDLDASYDVLTGMVADGLRPAEQGVKGQ